CFRMDQVVVQGYGADVELDPNAETTVCEDESLTLSVIATPLSVTYYWTVSAPGVLDSPISAHPVLSGPPGVYTVKVVVTDVICSDSLEFQVEILEGGDLEGQISIDLCKGLEVGFTNPNNIGGTWNFGDGSQTSIEINPIHIYGMADQYHVTFTPDVLLPCIALWDSTITVFDSVLTAGITHSYLECETKAIIQFNGSSNHAGNNTWDWTFPNGTPNNSTAQDPIVSYDDEGTYTATLVVTDINGCTATATDTVRVEIVNDTLPNPDPICPGDCVQLNPDGFDFGANYHWTSVPFDSTLIGQENIPNPTVCPLVPTIYTANISQGFCAIDLAVLVTFKQGGILTLPDDWVVCSDDSVSITALSNGATMFEWSIHANFDPIFATTQTVTVQPPGTFYVRTKGAECAAMDSVHIEIGEIEIEIVQIADIVCEGDFGTANALASNGTPPYTYTWFNNVPLPIGNNASIAGLTAGTYTVLATDGVGCTAIDTVNITVLSAPNALIDSVYVLECGDNLSTVRLISLSSDAFDQIDSLKWIFSGPVTNIVILQQDTVDIQLPVGDTIMVTLIVTSSLGCSDTTSLEFLVPGIPDFSISLDSTTLNCNGGPLTLIVNGDPDYDYSWEPAVTIIDSLHVSVNPTVPTTYVLTATDGGVCTAVDSIRVTPIDDDFQLIVLDSIIQTCDSTVTLFASTIPAGIATTIVWCQGNTPIGGNPIVVPVTSTPTIYTVKAITADSCFRMDQVVVQGYGVDVELDPNAETTVCEDESLTLSVIATPISVTYFWTVTAPGVLDSPFSAHPVLSGPPGVYNVKVIVTNVICFDSLEFQVEILEDGDLEGQISIDLCKGLEVGFTNPNNIGGTWNFGDGQVSIEIDPIHIYGSAGQYQVTFSPDTLLTCIAPWDSTITVFDSVLTAGITHLYVKCATEALVQFNGIANHAGNNTWSWTFPNGTPTTSTDQNQAVTYTDEGTYTATLVVTDINGCTATASYSFIVNILNDIIVDSLQICLGDCVQLNPDGFDLGANYQWTSVPFDSTLVGQENLPNPMVCPLVPTLYSVLISKGDCTVSYSVVVTFKPGSDVHIVPDPAASVCSMDLWTLTAQSNNATAFEWSSIRNFDPPFSDSQSVQVLPNGTYYVRTRGAECTAMDSIVIVLKIPEIQILPADYELCLGEQAALMFTNLISTDILTCDWGPNLPMDCNLIVSPSETSTYTVTVTNQYGCKDTLSFTVTVNMASVDAVADPNLVTAENPTSILTATPGGTGTIISYTWTPSGTLSSPNTAVTEASPTETTTYTVTVINSDGCLALDTVTVFVKPNNCISPFVFIPKAFTPNNDEKNDYFVPRADGMTALKFVVWDRWGEIVFETYDPNTLGWDGSFKGKTATPDAYAWYVRLTCGNGDIYEDRGNVTLLK
ncbi:MAG: PKD domain-containing protein, partial [Saprospiraceae bacterium]